MFYENFTGAQRRFWRWFFFTLMIFVLADLGLHWNSRIDRQHTRDIQERMAANETKNRGMLDARARIQISMIEAIKNGRTFTPAELAQIQELWNKSEYNLIREKFIDDTK